MTEAGQFKIHFTILGGPNDGAAGEFIGRIASGLSVQEVLDRLTQIVVQKHIYKVASLDRATMRAVLAW